ncbi:MAG: uroporphyrinogen decarboxylase family protein [Atribacterota bacterium]
MVSAERLKVALSHKEPDRIPLDLGGIVTGITLKAHHALCSFLGIPREDTLVDRVQYLVQPSEKILKRFAIDTRYVYDVVPQNVWSSDQEGSFWEDSFGVKRRFTGYYFDMVAHPLAHAASLDDLKSYRPPCPRLPENLRAQAESLKKEGYAVIVNRIGSVFEFAWYLRGFSQFMADLALEPRLACAIMDIVLEFELQQFELLLQEVGDLVDVVLVGDDLATQRGPLMSLDMYRKYVKPRQKKLYEAIKKQTQAFLFYHSCGAVAPFLEDLVEIGIDILNPVQVSASGMNPKWLKKHFGDVLSFWGGIDTQHVLPYGTPDAVREEVRRRIDELAPGGGYVLCAVHNIQPDVPPENIVAMYEEALYYGSTRG